MSSDISTHSTSSMPPCECGKAASALVGNRHLCWPCRRERITGQKARWGLTAEEVSADLEAVVAVELEAGGMARIETSAEFSKISPEIMSTIPSNVIAVLCQGQVPSAGFGLSGNTGIGKTMALAAMMKYYFGEVIKRHGYDLDRVRSGYPRWVNWADLSNRMQLNRFSSEVLNRLESIASAAVLVLDDLAAECLKNDYSGDFSRSNLFTVVNKRHRNRRPTWYTTNTSLAGLIDVYGAHFVSRLCGDNPLITLPKRKDRRFVRG